MRSRLMLCTFVFHIVAGAAIGHAQTVDPSLLEFDPSPDHASSLVAGYELRIHLAGSNPVIQQVPLGKPEVSADGKIRLSVAAILDSYPGAGPVYDASVATLGPGGESLSTPSNIFSFSPCEFIVTPDTQTLASDGGSFAVLVTARNGCSWGAGAGSGWLAASGSSTGTGSGWAEYSVQANGSSVDRSTTVIVAGQSITVVQLAWSATTTTGGSTGTTSANGAPSAPVNLRVLR